MLAIFCSEHWSDLFYGVPIVFVARKELKTMGMEVDFETDSVIMDE
jgi:hypothetical protein